MLVTASFGATNTGASVYYTLLNNDKSVAQARTNTGVTEIGTGSGTYGVNIADATLIDKTVLWDINGTTKFAIDSESGMLLNIDGELDTLSTRLTSTRAGNLDQLDAAITSRAAASTALSTAVWTNAKAAFLDASVNSRLAASGYTAPPAAVTGFATTAQLVAASGGIIDASQGFTNLLLARADVPTSTRLAASGYATPPTVGAIADAVWDEPAAAHVDPNSTAAAFTALNDMYANGVRLQSDAPGVMSQAIEGAAAIIAASGVFATSADVRAASGGIIAALGEIEPNVDLSGIATSGQLAAASGGIIAAIPPAPSGWATPADVRAASGGIIDAVNAATPEIDLTGIALTTDLAPLATEANATANREAIISAIDSTIVLGVGALPVVLTIHDGQGVGIYGVEVWVTSDAIGDDVVAGTVTTDADGHTPTLMLDAGTYYRWAAKSGRQFVNPQSFTVEG